MRILITHGYLLKGTGSNQYVQSLARALCRQGHHLLITCQDDDPSLDFVGVFMREEEGRKAPVAVWERETGYPGSCMVVKPDIRGLLPVYVVDTYEGFRVKEFTGLSDEELHSYVELNRRSHARLVEQFVPGAILTNHAVMLPAVIRPIAEETGVPYDVCIHGSAIEFTVKRDDRYLRYGADGLSGADRVFVPSEFTREQVESVFGESVERLEEKIVLMPPGVDTELFDLPRGSMEDAVERMAEHVAERTGSVTVGDFRGRSARAEIEEAAAGADFRRDVDWINGLHPDWIAEPDVADRMRRLAAEGSPFLVFLGKLLETKGVQCILPALPLLTREHPDLRLVVVGFGAMRGLLELMLQAMADGDVLRLRRLCEFGNRSYTRVPGAFDPVLEFLESLSDRGELDDYILRCTTVNLLESVLFTGYLTQEEHRHILPYARALLVPSLATEAFGLVATEAMACGVVPIASRHSGLQTAVEPLDGIWGRDLAGLSLEGRGGMIRRIAAACGVVLGMSPALLAARGREMRSVVTHRFSWDAVAERMVEIFEDAES